MTNIANMETVTATPKSRDFIDCFTLGTPGRSVGTARMGGCGPLAPLEGRRFGA